MNISKMLSAVAVGLGLCACSREENKVESNHLAKVESIHFATVEEGKAFVAGNEAYYAGMSPTDIAYRLQKEGGTIEELKAYAQEQVRAFTPEQEAVIREAMEEVYAMIAERGLVIPEVKDLTFVLTTQKDECGSSGYTHGTQIYMSEFHLPYLCYPEARTHLHNFLAHELFHCLTRNDPEFRRKMYSVIGFKIVPHEFEIPESLRECFLSNPDVVHHNSYATFEIGGKDVRCYVVTIATLPFMHKGDSFFRCFEPRLVSVDDPTKTYSMTEAENFWEVFGENTHYVIDPEETLADNFALAVVFGKEGPGGRGYPTKELIERIFEVLR